MENQSFSRTVKSLIESGEIGEAISVFKSALGVDPRQAQALRMLRVIESNWQLSRQNQQKGISTLDEARRESARAADSLLGLLDTVEKGGSGRVSPEKKMRRGLWLGVGIAAAVFAAVLVFYPKFRVGCPDFDESKALKVMVLPFGSLGGGDKNIEPPKVDEAIRLEINKLVEKQKLSVSTETKKGFNPEDGLPDKEKALRMAEYCGADLVIWGNFIQRKDSLRLQLQFASPNSSHEGTSDFRSLPDLSAFWDGAMDRELSDAVFAVCARVAALVGNKEVATRWLEKVKEPDAVERVVREKLAGAN